MIARRSNGAMLPPMRILICGKGFLGEEIAEQAMERGWHVDASTRSGGEGTQVCDLGDRDSVAQLATQIAVPDAIVHCASSGKGGAEAYQKVYVDGIKHLAEFFPKALILFTSSSSVYGQTDGSVVTEESPCIPDRETGRLLLEAENATREHGGIVCRLSGIYGPGRSVILKKFLLGEAVIEEDGRRFLNQIHRADAAAAILHLIDLTSLQQATHTVGNIFNVSDSNPLSQREIYEALATHFQRPLPPTGPRDLNRKRGWTHKQVSNERMRKLGWQLRYPSFLDAVPTIASSIC